MRRNNHENPETNFNPASIVQKGMYIGLQKPVLFQSLLFVSVVLHPLQASSQLVNKPRVETIVFPQLKVFSMLKQKQGTEKAGGLW